MLCIYTKTHNGLVQKLQFNIKENILPQNILWMDLLHPTNDEMNYIAKQYNLEIPTQEEREEIELSARYWEDSTTITINTHFLMRTQTDNNELTLTNETITFMTTQNIFMRLNHTKGRWPSLTATASSKCGTMASARNLQGTTACATQFTEYFSRDMQQAVTWLTTRERSR